MSEELLVRKARRRIEVFKNLERYLRIIVDVVKGLDENAEVYLIFPKIKHMGDGSGRNCRNGREG
ncbi:MAG: hypothetical protein J7L11_01375 [Thermoprotei archaeon]|nr:hypothetical protein [Thermoprotei archaeon]